VILDCTVHQFDSKVQAVAVAVGV